MYKESDTVELKAEITAEIKKEVIAFANTKGGTIYIGIADDGEVLGVDEAQRKCEQLSSMLHDGIKPDITSFIDITLESAETKEIIKITVRRGTRCPYYLSDKGLKPSGVYVRLANTSIPASETAIRDMIAETDGKSYEQVRSLEQELTFESAEKEFKDKGMELGLSQMRTLGITDNDGIFTNLGLLLSDQCHHTIKAAVFSGKEKEEFVTRKEFTGSLFKQIEDVYTFIDLNNKLNSSFEGLKRIDSRDYSESALREALLNAVIHRDYSFSGSTLISVFDDRIEFVSLGGLAQGLEENDIYMGISQSRNPKLANIFYRLDFVEAYGTGIQKIQKECRNNGVEPVFKLSNAAFKVVIPNKNYARKNDQPVNDTDSEIVDFIKANGPVSRKQIQDKFGLKLTKCTTLLKSLEQQGLIKREGNGKNTLYSAM